MIYFLVVLFYIYGVISATYQFDELKLNYRISNVLYTIIFGWVVFPMMLVVILCEYVRERW